MKQLSGTVVVFTGAYPSLTPEQLQGLKVGRFQKLSVATCVVPSPEAKGPTYWIAALAYEQLRLPPSLRPHQPIRTKPESPAQDTARSTSLPFTLLYSELREIPSRFAARSIEPLSSASTSSM